MTEDKGVYIVYTKVEPEQEDAFNKWYNETHIPDLMKLQCINGAQRFKLVGSGQEMRFKDGEIDTPQFLTIYFLKTGDADEVQRQLAEARPGWVSGNRLFNGHRVAKTAAYAALIDRVNP